MRTSLEDLISTCPQQLEANTMIIYDGCNRVLQQIPDGITCEDVLTCIDCEYILSLITFGSGLLVDANRCTITVDPDFVNASIVSTFDCTTGDLVIGTTTLNLACIADLFTFSFSDGVTQYRVVNGDTITVQGLHGLQAIVTPNLIQIDLPSGGTASQVLTWDAVNNVAYRANPMDVCCDQIQSCMAPIIAALQAEISIIAGQLCPCAPGEGTPMVIYDEGFMIHNTSNMNFIGDCITATRNNLTNAVDLTFDCAGIDGINIYDSSVLEQGDVVALNFLGCLGATWNAVTSQIDVSFDGTLARNVLDSEISLCGVEVVLPFKIVPYGFVNMVTALILETQFTVDGYGAFFTGGTTPSFTLPEIPGIHGNIMYRKILLYNRTTNPVHVIGAAGVTVTGSINTIQPGEATEYWIRTAGAGATEYVRIAG